jgi:hypothetical protein
MRARSTQRTARPAYRVASHRVVPCPIGFPGPGPLPPTTAGADKYSAVADKVATACVAVERATSCVYALPSHPHAVTSYLHVPPSHLHATISYMHIRIAHPHAAMAMCTPSPCICPPHLRMCTLPYHVCTLTRTLIDRAPERIGMPAYIGSGSFRTRMSCTMLTPMTAPSSPPNIPKTVNQAKPGAIAAMLVFIETKYSASMPSGSPPPTNPPMSGILVISTPSATKAPRTKYTALITIPGGKRKAKASPAQNTQYMSQQRTRNRTVPSATPNREGDDGASDVRGGVSPVAESLLSGGHSALPMVNTTCAIAMSAAMPWSSGARKISCIAILHRAAKRS